MSLLKDGKILIKDVRKFESLVERAKGKGNVMYLLLQMHEPSMIDELKNGSMSEFAKEKDNMNDCKIPW